MSRYGGEWSCQQGDQIVLPYGLVYGNHLLSSSVYMCVCVHVCADGCMFTLMDVHRGQPWLSFLRLCSLLCTHLCVVYLCVGALVCKYLCVRACMHVCGGQQLTSGVFFNCFPLYPLRHGFSTKPRAPLSPLRAEIISRLPHLLSISMASGNLGYMEKVLPAEPSLISGVRDRVS